MAGEIFQEIEDRLISGRGVLQIPQDDDYRWFRIWIDVIRDPSPNYQNFRWNPSRGEYAKVTWMRGNYVFKEDVIRYERTTWDYPVEPFDDYLAPAAICTWVSIFAKLEEIGLAVGLPPSPPGSLLVAEPVKQGVTSIRFDCREETAFQVRLFGLRQDIGCLEATPDPKENPQPSPPLPKVPTTDNIEVSSPYNPPDDDGNTIPFSGDPVPPPQPPVAGDPCATYLAVLAGEASNDGGNSWSPVSYTQQIYGQYSTEVIYIGDPNVVGSLQRFEMINQGIVAPGQSCGALESRLFQNAGAPNLIYRNFAFTVTPL